MFRRIKPLIVLAALALLTGQANAACWQWLKTAAGNANADPSINYAEGMSPSSVNDSARAMMARLAECRDDLSGLNVTSGTATAYSLASFQGTIAAIPNDGQQIVFRPHISNGIAPTLTVDGGTAYPIESSPTVAVSAGVLVLGTPYRVTFDLTNLAWMLQDFYNSTISAGSIVSTMLGDNAVTYQKLQKPSAASRLLGTPSLAAMAVVAAASNGSGLVRLTVADTTGLTTGQTKVVSGVLGTTEANGTWVLTVVDSAHVDLQGSAFVNAYVSGGVIGGAVEELTPGVGLTVSGNSISAAVPIQGGFKKLSIKVLTNTTVAVAADAVIVSDGSNYASVVPSGATLNLGTTGTNALDTGTIAIDSWYYVWVIWNGVSGQQANLASLSATSPTMPTGYTYKARIGAVRTVHGTAQLYGTWQFGRQARYVLGLAQTNSQTTTINTQSLPVMAQGNAGSVTTPTWVAVPVGAFVPPTATVINLIVTQVSGASAIIVAPNANYGTAIAGGPPFIIGTQSNYGSVSGPMSLESSNIYWANSGGTGGTIACQGWEDNL